MRSKQQSRLPTAIVVLFSFMLITVTLAAYQHIVIGNQHHPPSDPYDSYDLLANATISHIPGCTYSRKEHTLTIAPINYHIVSKDGSRSEPNNPVNTYGTYVTIDGSFALHAQISRRAPENTIAGIQLYSNPPIIADEFRVERASLRLEVAPHVITAKIWDGVHANPAIQASLPYDTPYRSVNLTATFHDKTIDIAVDEKSIGTLHPEDKLTLSTLWLGLDAVAGSWRLDTLILDGLYGGTIRPIDTSLHQQSRPTASPDALQRMVSGKRPEFLVGAAVALTPLMSDDQYRSIVLGGALGSITTENALKWQFTQPIENAFTFQESDALVGTARHLGLSVHGHTLVFGEANPLWVQQLPISTPLEKQRVERVMKHHIHEVVSHYKGTIQSWDVVNEPLADYDTFRPQTYELRNHIWHKAMGSTYIEMALRAAHQADPDAKLFINEYGLEEDGERWDAMVGLIRRLQKSSVPLHGIGFQSHIYSEDDAIDEATLRRHIAQLGRLGLQARISEIDVTSEPDKKWQADQYATVFRACYKESSCTSFTTWGVSDRYNFYLDTNGDIRQGSDFLWDKEMHPTPAVGRIRDSI